MFHGHSDRPGHYPDGSRSALRRTPLCPAGAVAAGPAAEPGGPPAAGRSDRLQGAHFERGTQLPDVYHELFPSDRAYHPGGKPVPDLDPGPGNGLPGRPIHAGDGDFLEPDHDGARPVHPRTAGPDGGHTDQDLGYLCAGVRHPAGQGQRGEQRGTDAAGGAEGDPALPELRESRTARSGLSFCPSWRITFCGRPTTISAC